MKQNKQQLKFSEMHVSLTLYDITYRLLIFIQAYGKCAEDITRYRNTILTSDPERYVKYKRMARCVNELELISCDDDFCAYEIQMKKTKVKDSKPVHIGVAILQHSKLLFLR